MAKFHYSIIRLTLGTIGGFLMGLGGIWMMGYYYGFGAFLGLMLAVSGPICALATFVLLFSDRVAMQLSADGFKYRSFFGGGKVRWNEIHLIDIEETRVNWFARQRHLKIDIGRGMFGNVRIPEIYLNKSTGNLDDIVDRMMVLIDQAANGYSSYDASNFSEAIPASRIEPQHSAQSAPAVKGGGFGRKGL